MAYLVIKHTKQNKYGNRKTQYEGRSYHSALEADYAARLDLLLKAGEIKEWIPQYKIDIKVDGKHVTNYYMDFRVVTKDDTVEFHEVKGAETDLWRIKFRLLEILKDQIEPGCELIVIKENNMLKKKLFTTKDYRKK